MKFDNYSIKGRILPAIVSIILPIMIFNHFYVSEEFSKFVGNILGAKFTSNLTISIVCLYLFSEFGRIIGKNIFEKKYFKDEKEMPTTNFMLFSDKTYSEDYKNKFRKKVKSDFNITLLTKKEENKNEDLSRIKIVETMALIRKKLYKNKFLLQHNIEYGMIRNVIGGSVIGVIFSIINILFFKYCHPVTIAVYICSVLLIIYLFIILLSKILINFYGRNYAKILFREYMG